ncbi:hypothetical protein [Streptomyces sp. TP-A0356]|uniref:ATP-dependent DNA ligase n=1 Tax=Streptomyces sp. TP-A0356 TaxID=1359208 RepID=UPI00099E857A|nr:hypothetical protein [Streptomyces sp. TP-A0356]
MSHETRQSLEKDGYRAQLAVYAGGRVLLRSRQGTNMTASSPEIRAAALAQLPADTRLDGEVVVWERDRLAFERLQQRLVRRGAGAAEAARQWPAHYLVFDLVHAGADLTGWSYERRRAALEELFADQGLEAPLTVCPSTTDPAVARGWVAWTAAGLEGLCFKRLDEPYRPVRSWRKYKNRMNCICHNTSPGLKKRFTRVRPVRTMPDQTAEGHDMFEAVADLPPS